MTLLELNYILKNLRVSQEDRKGGFGGASDIAK